MVVFIFLVIIVTNTVLSLVGRKELRKITSEIDAPLTEIIMRNYLINDSEITKLKRAYLLLLVQSSEKFVDAKLNLKILNKDWTESSFNNNVLQQLVIPIVPLFTLSVTILLSALDDYYIDKKMAVFNSIIYLTIGILGAAYILLITQNHNERHQRKVKKLINKHLTIIEEIPNIHSTSQE